VKLLRAENALLATVEQGIGVITLALHSAGSNYNPDPITQGVVIS
jgi:hypothetical protein